MRIFGAVTVLLATVAGVALLEWPGPFLGQEVEGSGVLTLAQPAFAQEASFLDAEAGIAAYADVGSTINLANAKRAFKVVESETGDFLIGVVGVTVPYMDDQKQPHVFVHRDGWVVAYFLQDESIGHAWPYGQGIKPPESILTTALNQVAGVSGFSLPAVGYYDFEFPSANRITVVNAATREGSFEVQIPTAFQVLEAAHTREVNTSYSNYSLVENKTSNIKKGEFQEWRGAIILVYREP